MTPMRRTLGIFVPVGMTFSVSIIATGTTGTCPSSTIRATPVRPRYSLPSGLRVPSG